MFNRRVPFVAALSPLALALLLMAPGTVDAVELGTLNLQSGSGQPLEATIALSDVEGLSVADLRVELASPADFQRFSLERLAALETLQIAVDFSGAAPVLKLTSPVTINEPFLSLVLDARWPAGRVLTEYMIRLESPAFSAGSALTSSTPVRTETVPLDTAPLDTDTAETPAVVSNAPVASGSSTAAAPAAATPAASPAAPAPAVISNASTITVNAGDTLWELAQRVRPDTSVSVQQTMLALQRLNPEAFIAGNINRVRRGEVLQVPELSEIRRIASAEAVAEVSRQNREFASGAAVPAAVSAPTSTVASNPGAQGELRVVTVQQDADSQQANTGGSGNQTTQLDQQIEALEDRIALREEDLSRLDVQNEELNARLALLQQQITAAQEIIRLRDLELAQLQQQLVQEGSQASTTAAVEPPLITMAPDAGPVQRLMHLLTSNTWAMLAAAAALVLLLVLIMVLRNRSAAQAKAQASARENDSMSLGADDDELLFTGVTDSVDTPNDTDDVAVAVEADVDAAPVLQTGAAAYQSVQDSTGNDSETDFDNLIQQELKHSATADANTEQTFSDSTVPEDTTQPSADDWQPDDLSDNELIDDDRYQLDIGETAEAEEAEAVELPADFDLEDVAESETGADLSWPDEERSAAVAAEEPPAAEELPAADEFDISQVDEEPHTPASRTRVADEFDDLAFLPAEDEFTDQALAAADDDDDDFEFLAGTDEVASKLDLARAYIDMGDSEGAREILEEVLREGSEEQRTDAQDLLGRL